MKLFWNQYVVIISTILISLPYNITSQDVQVCVHCEIELLSCQERCVRDVSVIFTCTRDCLSEQVKCLKEWVVYQLNSQK